MPRTRLYHETAPAGKIFDEPRDIQQAIEDGWVEAPWLIGGPPKAPPADIQEKFESGIPDEPEPIVKRKGRPSKKG